MISMSTGHKRADIETHMAGSDIDDVIIDAMESMHESEEVLWHPKHRDICDRKSP